MAATFRVGDRVLTSGEQRRLLDAAGGRLNPPDQQLLAELLIEIGKNEVADELRRMQSDALVALARAEPNWRIPKGKALQTACEHCGARFGIRRRRRHLSYPVAWDRVEVPAAWTIEDVRPAILRAYRRAGLSEGAIKEVFRSARMRPGFANAQILRRYTLAGEVLVRWLLVCERCSRRKIRRCRWDEPCENFALPGAWYCAQHRP
jgi:hypothetical protein